MMTIPTNGPLFGSFKVQLDVFKCPIRLYMKELHNNQLNIGMNMATLKLPQLRLRAKNPEGLDVDNYQIEPSSIFSYLNMRGLGHGDAGSIFERDFNALPFLCYWDIYKNYYANKQEEIGAVIHNGLSTAVVIEDAEDEGDVGFWGVSNTSTTQTVTGTGVFDNDALASLVFTLFTGEEIMEDRMTIVFEYGDGSSKSGVLNSPTFIFETDYGNDEVTIRFFKDWYDDPISGGPTKAIITYDLGTDDVTEPKVTTFPLTAIDDMRNYLLMNSSVNIGKSINIPPYSLALEDNGDDFGTFKASMQYKQEGLALKTYQSDLFNNWLSTEWLDGDNGINEITKVMVVDDGIYLDDLNIMQKVFYMLNRVAVSDGSYKSWLETVYAHKVSNWVVESPMYVGGLIKELTFDEVISTAEVNNESVNQPLGSLGGRGVMGGKNKGGYINVKADEPCILLGLISLTPRIDYSQGNKWDTNLKTMDDLHKPQLDGIGFQDVITDQMHFLDTRITNTGKVVFKSAGKQPAWINYMTNVNQCRGNFAIDGQEMFMTLNRKYEIETAGESIVGIGDLTTYIDPVKFNDIFSVGKLDTMNFWAQIKVDIKARRKMSAKVMPNL